MVIAELGENQSTMLNIQTPNNLMSDAYGGADMANVVVTKPKKKDKKQK